MSYVTGTTIKELRIKNHMTQKDLADVLMVSDKTISKWETGRGLPDVGIITELAESLNVSVAELLAGEYAENKNRCGNMTKLCFYVCPVCGNVIASMGEGSFSCCGILLPLLECEEQNSEHLINVETIDGEHFVSMAHPMEKNHYISFVTYATSGHFETVKLYPEQNPQARFSKKGHGFIYVYCNKHGLYKVKV